MADRAAEVLFGVLRQVFPEIPLHCKKLTIHMEVGELTRIEATFRPHIENGAPAVAYDMTKVVRLGVVDLDKAPPA